MLHTGDKIRKVRLEKKLTQAVLAEKLGISQNAYHKLENNETKIKFETLLQIAEILETEMEHFIPESTQYFNIHHNRIKNQKNGSFTTNIVSGELKALYETQLKDKEAIIRLKDEKIALLEEILKQKS